MSTEEIEAPSADVLYELFRGYQVARWGTTDPGQIRTVAANFVTSKFQPAPALRHLAEAAYRVGWQFGHSQGLHANTEMAVDARVEEIVNGEVGQLFMACEDEASPLWLQLGAVIEKVAPGIAPYDRREAVAEVIRAIAGAMDYWGLI